VESGAPLFSAGWLFVLTDPILALSEPEPNARKMPSHPARGCRLRETKIIANSQDINKRNREPISAGFEAVGFARVRSSASPPPVSGCGAVVSFGIAQCTAISGL
jgi:hypothetical protein